MSDFKEYFERFSDATMSFIKSRWIRSILLTLIIFAFIICIVLNIWGTITSKDWFNTLVNTNQRYGRINLSIPGLIIGVFGLIWTVIIMKNQPCHRKFKLKGFYRAWKLWYWMPSCFVLAIVESIIWLYLIILFGKYTDGTEEKVNSKNLYKFSSFYNKYKLWYWIPSLGIGILFEYLAIFTIKIIKNNIYYWDIILLIIIFASISMTFGSIAWYYRETYITT